MIKQYPFDDYNQTLHLFATTVGTLTPQWGENRRSQRMEDNDRIRIKTLLKKTI
jgi:hypothetical protein